MSALARHEYDLRMSTSPSSDSAARYRRVLVEATAVLGADVAGTYLRTRNFALGGTASAELLVSSEGGCVVLNELRTQVECGPP